MELKRRAEEAEAPWRKKLAETGDTASPQQMFGIQLVLGTDETQKLKY